LKQHYRRSKESQLVDTDFAEALYGGESNSRSAARQAQRKARQFCRQVQRALNLALENRDAVLGIGSVYVEEVCPAPDCGRVLVYVVVPDGLPVADALGALRRDAPRLRSEVAAAITRKRAPELSFVPVIPDGASHE
jgi:ribosome-binding factor A